MRKIFTSILSVAAATAVAMAAMPQPTTVGEFNASVRSVAPCIEKLTPAQRSSIVGASVNGRAFIGKNVANNSKLAHRYAKPVPPIPGQAPSVIDETPAGTPKMYARSGDGFMLVYGYILPHDPNGQILNTVMADDNKTIYIQDPVSSAIAETWVKGTVEDSKISVPTGQYIMYEPSEGYGAILAAGKLTEVEDDGDIYLTYVMDETVTDITFNIADDGSVKLDDKYSFTFDASDPEGEVNPEYIVTVFWDDDKSWAGYADYNTAYTPFDDVTNSIPEAVVFSDWKLSSVNVDSEKPVTTFVSVGIEGDKMYITGLYRDMPEAVVAGTITDGKVTLESNQYLGISDIVYLTYFVGGTYSVETFPDPDFGDYNEVTNVATESIVFNYDADAKTLTAPDNAALYINAGRANVDTGEGISQFASYFGPSLSEFHEVAATPATPEILEFGDYFDDYGCIGISMYIPTVDTEGNDININKLYYVIYTRVDGEEEEFVFYPDEYVGLEEMNIDEMTEVPYTMQIEGYDGVDIRYGGEDVFFYTTLPDAYGVKSVYKGGGEVHESPVFWLETAGVNNVLTNGAATVSAVYGIDGIRRSEMSHGLNIVRMSDGSVRKIFVR